MPDRQISKGQTELTKIISSIFPNENIINEYPIGNQLRLDIYCPSFKVGLEYHGIQHFRFVQHFHGTYGNYLRAQELDLLKINRCKELGISLVAFNYDEELSKDFVYDRVMAAITNDISSEPVVKPKKESIKGNPIYEEMKARRREYSKELRAKMKAEKKKNK